MDIENLKSTLKKQNISRENVWFLLDVFCSCIWLNVELILESQNTKLIMHFEKMPVGIINCYIARDDWSWFIEIYDLHQRWLFVEEDALRDLFNTKPLNFYGNLSDFENDLILFKLFSQ